MTATVMFNGSLYFHGEVLRTTPKRMLVRFTTGTGTTREKWFTTVPKPAVHPVSRRLAKSEENTIPANSGFVN